MSRAAKKSTGNPDVIKENGRIVLTPMHLARVDAVRIKLVELGLSETDICDAVDWSRSGMPDSCRTTGI